MKLIPEIGSVRTPARAGGKVYLVDNFLAHPERLHVIGAKLKWEMRAPSYESSLPAVLTRKIAEKMNEVSEGAVDWRQASYRGQLRMTPAEALRTNYRFRCHYEPGWNSLVYLNKGLNYTGGTGFYIHIRSGLDGLFSLESWKATLVKLRCSSDELVSMLYDDQRKPSRWQQVGYVGAKFNRLLIFDGMYFHSHVTQPGIRLLSDRFTMNYYGPTELRSINKNLMKLWRLSSPRSIGR